MIEVSVRELKNKLSEYLRRAQAGEQILVTKRGQGVVSMGPASVSAPKTLDEKWADLERRGIVTHPKRSGKMTVPEKLIKLRGEGPSVSEMIIRDRR